MIHIVKGFGLVSKAEVIVFMELSCFFNDPVDSGSLVSGSSVFSKSSLNIWVLDSCTIEAYPWRILSIALLAYEMGAIVRYFEHSLALPFFETGMKTDLFQSCGHC